MENLVRPWFPHSDLPQLPCDIEVTGGPEQVTLRVVYSYYGGARDLMLEFSSAEVFGCFSEFATPPTLVADDYPRLQNQAFAKYLWPLMEVTGSTWLAAYRERLWISWQSYRHYRVVGEDGSFDILTAADPRARWASPAWTQTPETGPA
jgi:hypothetical protein